MKLKLKEHIHKTLVSDRMIVLKKLRNLRDRVYQVSLQTTAHTYCEFIVTTRWQIAHKKTGFVDISRRAITNSGLGALIVNGTERSCGQDVLILACMFLSISVDPAEVSAAHDSNNGTPCD